ncbi:MAG: type II secretion system protein [Verrucomicrobiota bacterium]
MNTPQKPLRPANRAFTMVELLVVISIIAILAGISLVAFASIKKTGTRMQGVRTFEQTWKTIETYKAQNQGYYPGSTNSGGGLAGLQSAQRSKESNLAFYLADVFNVDGDREVASEDHVRQLVPDVLIPTIERAGRQGWNRDLFYLFHIEADIPPRDEVTLSSLNPSASYWGRPGGVISFNKAEAPMFSDIYMGKQWEDFRKSAGQKTFWGDVFNVLFVDGHVESIKEPNFKWRNVAKGR